MTTKNEYNALHWRVHKYARITPSSVSYDESRRMRYSAGWQLLEESIDDDYSSGQGHDETRLAQQVWGARYIDDAVLRRIDRGDGSEGPPDGDFDDDEDDTYFYLTDAQFSVRALIREATGLLAERVFYDAYGRSHWRSPADFNSDGAVDTADATAFLAVYNNSATHDPSSSSYDHRSDFTNDGVVNTQDTTQFLNAWNAPQPTFADSISVTGAAGPDNPIGYCGYVFNAENAMYTVRFRHYEPMTGRWMERDPLSQMWARPSLRTTLATLAYNNAPGDGLSMLSHRTLNLLEYSDTQPISKQDSTGLSAVGLLLQIAIHCPTCGPLDKRLIDAGTYMVAARALADEAKEETARWWAKSTRIDGSGDAFRHCFWSCMMEGSLGTCVAQLILKHHESESTHNNPQSRNMDMANNALGSRLAHMTPFLSKDYCLTSCINAYFNGQFVIIGIDLPPA